MPEFHQDGDGHDATKVSDSGVESGHAALLLVESLIHHLVSRSILSARDAIEIVEVATEVEREVALTSNGGVPPPTPPSILSEMANSLRFELKE